MFSFSYLIFNSCLCFVYKLFCVMFLVCCGVLFFFFFKQKTAYEMRISDWSSDVCSSDLPVFRSGRGGQYTYHGPGQRVGYILLDLDKRGRDVRNFVHSLETWISEALLPFGISAYAVDGRVGLWVDTPEGEAKIAAIGIRVRRWVTFHGFAINVRSEEHTSELQSLMRISYAVFCLKKKKKK